MDFDCVDGLIHIQVDVQVYIQVDIQVDVQVDVALQAHHINHL